MKYDIIEVLLVEDNSGDANLTLRALKKSGFSNNIYLVKDGVEALDFIYYRGAYEGRLKKNHLRPVLLDLKIPKISGMEVLEKMKSDPELKTIPVVILTSSKEDPDIKRAYALGANSYIVKPVEGDNLFYAIKDLGFYWLISNQAPNG